MKFDSDDEIFRQVFFRKGFENRASFEVVRRLSDQYTESQSQKWYMKKSRNILLIYSGWREKSFCWVF